MSKTANRKKDIQSITRFKWLLAQIDGVEPPALSHENLNLAERVIEQIADRRPSANADWLLSILQGLDSDRIWRCLQCGSVFYAEGRSDRRVCSTSCGNLRRVKRSRAKQNKQKAAAAKKAERKAAKELSLGAKRKNARKKPSRP